jgi:hypothetical protein
MLAGPGNGNKIILTYLKFALNFLFLSPKRKNHSYSEDYKPGLGGPGPRPPCPYNLLLFSMAGYL